MDPIYSPTALNLKASRKWNLEKYHMYSMILELLVYYKGSEINDCASLDDIKNMFKHQGIPKQDKKFDAKINAALAQLVWVGYITCDGNYVSLTNDGIQAYKEQRFHTIAANLYNAENTKRLSIIAIIIAVLSFVTTILIACLS